jgi:hypothetical protein
MRFTRLGSTVRAVTSSTFASDASASAIFATWKVCAHRDGRLPDER